MKLVKSLLHEVEETISLSSMKKEDKTKLIEVRPFHEFVKQEDKSEDSELLEQTSVQLEIERARQRLHSIEQQRQSILTNLKREIEEEKEEWEKIKQDEMARVKQEGFE